MISFHHINPGQQSGYSSRIGLSSEPDEGFARFELAIWCLGAEIGRITGKCGDQTFVVHEIKIPAQRHWVLLDTILDALIRYIRERLIGKLVIHYIAEDASLDGCWERALQKYGFSYLNSEGHHFTASPSIFAPRWLNLRVGKEFHIRPWNEIEELAGRSILNGSLNGHSIPDDQLPVTDGRFFDKTISQGLLFGDKLVGWIQAWSDERDTSRMAICILYVDVPLQKRGVGIRFLASFLRRFSNKTQYHFCVSGQNQAMINFVTKHIGASLIRTRIRYTAMLKL